MSSPYEELAIVGVTASGHDGHVPANVLDKSLDSESRWSVNGLGSWIQFELAKTQTVYNIDIAWYRGNERKASFEVQTSEDGIGWKTVFSGQSSGLTTEPEKYDFDNTLAKFVRIVGNGATYPDGGRTEWTSILHVSIEGVYLTQLPTPPDTTAPSITPPDDISVTVPEEELPLSILLGNASVPTEDPAVVVTNDAPATFGEGETVVTWTATDAAGNQSTATQRVTVTAIKLKSLTLAADKVDVLENEEVTFTATATNTDDKPRQGEDITFTASKDGAAAVVIGNGLTDTTGKAVLKKALAVGKHEVVALSSGEVS